MEAYHANTLVLCSSQISKSLTGCRFPGRHIVLSFPNCNIPSQHYPCRTLVLTKKVSFNRLRHQCKEHACKLYKDHIILKKKVKL
uniref:Uncharacterized protein n=1 Tax=Arundo donax TaxID=35708 RepID=A0A0A9D9G2_ARUDO